MNNDADAPAAKIKHTRTISPIWIIPVVAVLIGTWMIYEYISSRGVLITIEFDNADGLQINKTPIKIKNIVIGKVTDLQLLGPSEKIVVSARINKEQSLLDEDSRFWVIRPRIGNRGVTGLDTLLSGSYIELSPGNKGHEKYAFIGLESPPVTPLGAPGLHVNLVYKGDRPFQIGDPVLFRGITTGQIEQTHFDADKRVVYYNAFIESPYDKLLTTNTRFWQVNGVEVVMSTEGLRVEAGSLMTILAGGISFDIPFDELIGEPVKDNETFTIYPNKDAISEHLYNYEINYILLFSDSIRGLKPLAPVEFRGVKVGHVVKTDLNYPNMGNLLKKDTLTPIMISIEPARLGLPDTYASVEQTRKDLDELLKKGLHAELAYGALITGSKIITLQYAESSKLELQEFDGHRVIPTVVGNVDQILSNANRVMDKINKLPLNEIAANTNKTIIEAAKTLASINKSAAQLDKILSNPASQELITTLNSTLSNIDSIAEGFSQGSPGQQALQDNMELLKQILLQLQPLLLQLNQQPNSLIFSGQKLDDIEPKGAQQ